MHIDLDGENTHNLYEAFGQQPSSVEYEEFDDRLTVKATFDGCRSITLIQHYGGAAECFLARTDSGISIRSCVDDVGLEQHRRQYKKLSGSNPLYRRARCRAFALNTSR